MGVCRPLRRLGYAAFLSTLLHARGVGWLGYVALLAMYWNYIASPPYMVFPLTTSIPLPAPLQPHLRPVLALAAEEMYAMSPGKAVYLSHAQGDHLEKDWVAAAKAKAKAAKAKAMAAGDAVAVAVAAAAAGAAEAAAGAAIAKGAAAAGGAADLYATARAFLLENPEFQLIWVSAACMPTRFLEQKWRGAVPSTAGSNVFEHLHPGALLVCDAMLVAPPERGSLPYEVTERYTELEAFR